MSRLLLAVFFGLLLGVATRMAMGHDHPPPQTCEDTCKEVAQQAHDACVAGGTDTATCDAQAQAMLEQCLTDQCGVAPPSTCTEQCEVTAQQSYNKALGRGRSGARAARHAQFLFHRCENKCARTGN